VKFKPGKEMRDEVLKLSPDSIESAQPAAPDSSTPPAAE
jgi:hypothetical protein